MQYRALVRQNDRYNQILETCASKDAEREVKQINAIEAKKMWNERIALQKQKIAEEKRLEDLEKQVANGTF